MATALELRGLFSDSTLRNKVETAVCITAQKIASGNDDEAPFNQAAGYHTARLRWAAAAIKVTAQVADEMLKLVLAQNNTLTVAQIQAASDAAIYSAVDGSVDAIARASYWDASEAV